MIDLLLDLANIVGGFLLAIGLLQLIPSIGDNLRQWNDAIAPFAWIVGVIALITGGYFLIDHLTSGGGHIYHFEVVGICVGVALLWSRLTGRASLTTEPHSSTEGLLRSDGTATRTRTGLQGTALLLAIFGVIAIIVGIEGIFTPN